MANAASGYKWSADNVFDNWDLNPLAQQVGGGADGVRDSLSASRDAFLQPKYSAYRDALTGQGQKVSTSDQDLYGNEGFQNYVRSGQLPANATPTQQWNAQPAQMSPAAPAPGTPASTETSLLDLVQQRAQAPAFVSREDPNVRAQSDAYSANQQRAARNSIADIAESQGPLANITAETRLANERAGQASGSFEAEVLARAQQQKAQEIQQYLSIWGGLIDSDKRAALERELATMQNSTQQQALGNQLSIAQMSNQTQNTSLNNQMDQFLKELALREANQNNTWEYQWSTLGL